MLKNIKVGKVYRIENKEKKNAANDFYNMIVVENKRGECKELLFTTSDLTKALKRSKSNREDIGAYTIEDCQPSSAILVTFSLLFVAAASFAIGFFIESLGIF